MFRLSIFAFVALFQLYAFAASNVPVVLVDVRTPSPGAVVYVDEGKGISNRGNLGHWRFFEYKSVPVGKKYYFYAQFNGKFAKKIVTAREGQKDYKLVFAPNQFTEAAPKGIQVSQTTTRQSYVPRSYSSPSPIIHYASLASEFKNARAGFRGWDYQAAYKSAVTKLRQAMSSAYYQVPSKVRSVVKWESLYSATKDTKLRSRSFWLVYLGRFYKNEEGFDLDGFRNVRNSLRDLSDAALFANLKDVKKAYFAKLDALEKGLKALQKRPNDAIAYADVIESLEFIQKTGRAKSLVKAVYGRYSQPNSIFEVQYNYVSSAFTNTQGPETVGVNENILGARVTGTSQNSGTTTAVFVAGEPARVWIDYRGTGTVSTVGTKMASGPLGFRQFQVNVHSSGIQSHHVGRYITLNSKSLSYSSIHYDPVRFIQQSAPSVQPFRLTRRGRLRPVRGPFARKQIYQKAYQQMPQSTAIGLQRATDKMINKFSGQFNNAVRNLDYPGKMEKYHKPLRRLGMDPYKLRWVCPSSQSLLLKQWRALKGQLEAPTSAPHFGLYADVNLRWHQSDFNNMSARLRGARLDYDNLLYDPAEFKKKGKNLDVEALGRKWSMTLDEWRPKLIQFNPSEVTVQMNVQSYRMQEKAETDSAFVTVETPIRVVASYSVRAPMYSGEKGPIGSRKSIRIEYLDKAYKPKDKNLHALFEQNLRGFFREKFQYDKVIGPIDEKLGSVNFGKLQKLYLTQVAVKKGWMYFGLSRR